MKLNDQMANSIRDSLVALLDPAKIIVFGSFGRGDATEDSDIDIAVIAENNQLIDIDTMAKGRLAVRKALKGASVPVDFVMQSRQAYDSEKNRIGSPFHTIDNEGVVLYERH